MRIVLPLIAVVLLAAADAELKWWILAAIAVYSLYRGGRRIMRWHRAQAVARVDRQVEIHRRGVAAL